MTTPLVAKIENLIGICLEPNDSATLCEILADVRELEAAALVYCDAWNQTNLNRLTAILTKTGAIKGDSN